MDEHTLPQDELRDLYRELILDHARNPRHFGKLDNVSHEAEGINPLCGDKLKLYFRVGENEVIEDAKFEGSGCAISVASASLLTDTVIGLTTSQALDYFSAINALLATDNGDQAVNRPQVDLSKLKALQGVREFPSRVKCATLAWHGLNSAINKQKKTVSTE
jgi:nitrogen fixation NifU-like protein